MCPRFVDKRDLFRAVCEDVLRGIAGRLCVLLAHGAAHRPDQVRPLSHLLFGALCQAGIAIAAAEDPGAARDEYRASIAALLAGIGAPGEVSAA